MVRGLYAIDSCHMTIAPQSPDFSAIKSRQRQTWASGDYHVIAAIIVPISERFVDSVDLRAGQHVLDVATGSGNTAIAAARRLTHVKGVDYVPALLERARQRAEAEGLQITFAEGDAEALPVDDAAFDVVLSSVGVMFSPNQEQVARELLRVCRPGGRIGLVNWTPEGWIGAMFRAVGRHVAPPPGVKPGTRWGTEEGLRELLGDSVSELVTTRQEFVWRFESAEQFLHLFRTYYGPTVKAFEALDDAGQQALTADLLEVLAQYARPADDGTLLVPAEYLEAVATRTA
jgi:ubiquinone/menaquinone biosynthesis C-methylase UbiE